MIRSDLGILGNDRGQLAAAGQAGVRRESGVLVCNNIAQLNAFADIAATHDDAVSDFCTLCNAGAGEDDAVFKLTICEENFRTRIRKKKSPASPIKTAFCYFLNLILYF